MENCIDLDIRMEHITFRCTFSKRISGFDCFSFSYYVTNQHSLDFDEAAIWMDTEKKLLVVFTRNERLLDYMILYMRIELSIHCKPLDVGIQSFYMQDKKGVITSTYKQSNTNKVTTSLMRTDVERLKVIEKIVVGDYFEGRIREGIFS